jgi:hypothetical protein
MLAKELTQNQNTVFNRLHENENDWIKCNVLALCRGSVLRGQPNDWHLADRLVARC